MKRLTEKIGEKMGTHFGDYCFHYLPQLFRYHLEQIGRIGKYEKFPSSIFVDSWVQLISPLLAPEQTQKLKNLKIV